MTPLEQSYRLILLTQGQYALVSECDYLWLMQWKWYARWNPGMKSFYACRKIKRNGRSITIQMHREILGLSLYDPRKGDHIVSGSTLDNRRSNLRPANSIQNSQNQRTRVDNSSGTAGVYRYKRTGKWIAYITYSKKRIHLGCFNTYEEACARRQVAVVSMFGEFAPVVS